MEEQNAFHEVTFLQKNLTEGKPLPLILKFFLPLYAGSLLQQFYNMVDGIIVSNGVGLNAFAAVGSTASLSFLIIGFATGICSGFGIPISQSFGARHYSEMRKRVFHAFLWTAIIAILMTTLATFATRPLLVLMQTPADILDDAEAYIGTIFLGIATTLLYNISASVLRAIGDSRSPILFLSITLVLNLILDLLFVFPMQMGVFGAALATVISQGFSGVISIIYMFARYPFLRLKKEDLTFDSRTSAKLLGVGFPMAFQTSITATGSVILQWNFNSLGTEIIASIAAAGRVQSIFTMPYDAFGIAMATYCGQNYGAGKLDRIRLGVRQATFAGIAYSMVATLIIFFLGKYISYLFIDPTETVALQNTVLCLRISSVFYIMLMLINLYRSCVQGIGHAASTLFAGILELIARTLIGIFLIPRFGLVAAAFAHPAAWTVASIYVFILFHITMNRLKKRMEPNP